MTRLGAIKRTLRGFEYVQFADRYGVMCSLQASSLADSEKPGASALWIGPDEPNPKVMARDAADVGVKTDQTTGWVPYDLPFQVSTTTRAHLDREQVQALICHLQAWLDNGTFEVES
jgi:hypothetical protein